MKKVLLLLVCLFTLQTVVWADDDKPIQVNQLPQTAQTFIKTHFPNNKVAMAKMETDWFDKSYDVIFTNGDKLEFDKKGIWTEVNCKYSAVPVAVVPDAVRQAAGLGADLHCGRHRSDGRWSAAARCALHRVWHRVSGG